MFDALELAQEIWRLRSERYRSAPATIPDEFAEDVEQAVANLLGAPALVEDNPDLKVVEKGAEFLEGLGADIILDGLSDFEALLVFRGRHDRPNEIMAALTPFAMAARIFDHLTDEHAAMQSIAAGGITVLDLRRARDVFKEVAIASGRLTMES